MPTRNRSVNSTIWLVKSHDMKLIVFVGDLLARYIYWET